MSASQEIIFAVFLLTGLMLSASSRLLHCIRIVVVQGVLLGILPLLIRESGEIHADQWVVSGVNILVKGGILPYLLVVAMRRARVKRELEPIVGYSTSLVIASMLVGFSFWVAGKLPVPGGGMPLVMPVAFSTMLIGLFLVVSRRKAITQVIGFLTFENGISLFGAGLMLEYGMIIELGILLDVFVLVFVMGIAVFQISREFEHIDVDRLNRLGDGPVPEAESGEPEGACRS